MTRRGWFARRRIPALAAVIGLAGALAALAAAPAAAHEPRGVGPYRLVVGFGEEPAYAGAANSVHVHIADARGRPVTDLGGELRVEVTRAAGAEPLGRTLVQGLIDQLNQKAGTSVALAEQGNREAQGDTGPGKLAITLEPNFRVGAFGEPGDYRAWFVPTAPGAYSFHLRGKIRGQRVDQRFTSSPTTFAEVEDPARVQFPTKEPTGSQLATRLDREVPRLQAALAASSSRADRAAGNAAQAQRLAIAGVVLGALGVLVAVAVALRRQPAPRPRRRSRQASQRPR
jgi:hypothetical protein